MNSIYRNKRFPVATIYNTEYLKRLLREGADINEPNEHGNSALMLASSKGLTSMVVFLVQNGANVNYANKDGQTALMWAAYEGHEATVELLLKNGANSKQQDAQGYTASMWADQEGYTKIVRLLSTSDVNPMLQGVGDRADLMLGVREDSKEIVDSVQHVADDLTDLKLKIQEDAVLHTDNAADPVNNNELAERDLELSHPEVYALVKTAAYYWEGMFTHPAQLAYKACQLVGLCSAGAEVEQSEL